MFGGKTMIIAAIIISLLGGGVAGYFIGDGLAPKSAYVECIKTVRSGKGGANIRDCDHFAREKTTKGMLENYRLCYEISKVADKPEGLDCDTVIIEPFKKAKAKEDEDD
jgi:hypothetical protein